MRGSMGLLACLSLRSTCAAVPSFENRRGQRCLERPPGGERGQRGGNSQAGAVAGCEDQLGRRTLRVCNATHAAVVGVWTLEQRIGMSVDMSSKLDRKSKRWRSEMARRKDSPVQVVGHPALQMRDSRRYQDALLATRLWSGVRASSLPCAPTSADP